MTDITVPWSTPSARQPENHHGDRTTNIRSKIPPEMPSILNAEELLFINEFIRTMKDRGQDRSCEDNDEDASSCLLTTSTIERYQEYSERKRLEIRQNQRTLRKEIPNIAVDEAIQRNNAIFEENREFGLIREAVLDADNLQEIVKQASTRMGNPMEVLRYDIDSVIHNLFDEFRVTRAGESSFDWKSFGKEVTTCFNAVPGRINFLNGPLVDGNERAKQRVKYKQNSHVESDLEEERPIDVQGHTERGANRLSAVDGNIQNVQRTLIKKVKRTYESNKRAIAEIYDGKDAIPKRIKKDLKRNKDVCAIELLFDPKSFTKTVENIYNYSFLVKEGKVSLKVRNELSLGKGEDTYKLDGGPVASCISNNDNNKKSPPKPRQAIVSLTMEDWKNLVEAYDVKEAAVKQRDP